MSKKFLKKIVKGIAGLGLLVSAAIAGKKAQQRDNDVNNVFSPTPAKAPAGNPTVSQQGSAPQPKPLPTKKAKATTVWGWILASLGALMLIPMGDLSEYVSTFFYGLIFLVPGIILIISGANLKKKCDKYNAYLNFINLNKDLSLEKIAYATSNSIENVAEDLQTMVSEGYIANAYVDMQNRCLVIKTNAPITIANKHITPPKQHTVSCPSCGANNTLTEGQVCECEYCGAPLKYEQ